ncbi:HTTM domain-containing protein [Mucilaginibacter sp. SP1R1]|uniref:HTTM domain-containing protein n=1 Tax=Mucilaginibacter sp. SP1R1 TaxID=2723091 RepID=UPI00161D5BDB|nr:HTTM domain-containing protein [Mucilaginibacter sp. SP1R1]MBB6149374.1 hypothetical protein [Mucilaginibacter sp. SP1R1]
MKWFKLIQFSFSRLQQPVSAAPLATFRMLFGLMMFAGTLRFWLNGWIDDLYVKPHFYFSYMGFEWVHPLGGTGMHVLFIIIAVASLLVAAGLWYRISIITFFLSFTYVELIDATNYLNHYYFISLIGFLLIWLPAGGFFSLDTYFNPKLRITKVPLWMIGIIRLQIGLVYFFAGLAKLNTDWMLHAIPMKIWLPAKSHLPIIGQFMYTNWIAYLFSWFGAGYDLLIAFFLINRKTRPMAYLVVLGFHIATAVFFPSIGMFPYVMMVSSLIFFGSATHLNILQLLSRSRTYSFTLMPKLNTSFLKWMLGIYFLIQLVVPLRFLLYPGHLFWYEEGYRFSWRVMLMEKSGNTFFYVKEPSTGKTYEVDNSKFLTPLQDKMMSTQPDLILRYAHYLATVYQQRGLIKPAVYADCYVALNGERSRPFVDTTVNLAAQSLSWKHYNWVLPYKSNEK